MTDPNIHRIFDSLAEIIDREGIADVLGMLAQICVGKAEHEARANRDNHMAECWMELAGHLDQATDYAMDEIVAHDPGSEGYDDDEA